MLGFETLTFCPIERSLIVAEMLSPRERAWLDAYHARVVDVIGSYLDADERAWLAAKCAPIA
jgi:Xaa-Pro aminopeptidase